MKIYFCDLCNESVPHQDLEEGRAFLRKGRVVCASCDHAMGGKSTRDSAPAGGLHQGDAGKGGATALAEAPARVAAAPLARPGAAPDLAPRPIPEAPTGGAGLGLWAGLCALVFSVGAVAMLVERLKTIEARVPEQSRLAVVEARSFASEQVRQAELRRDERLELLRSGVQAELISGREASERRLEELSASQRELATGVAKLREDMSTLLTNASERANADARLRDDLAARLAAITEEQRWVGERLTDLEVGLKSGAFGAPAGGSGSALPGGVDPTGGTPPWSGLLADLASPNTSRRWDAVDALGETGDPRVVPHLLPMLKDPEVFVRMAAARRLGDLKSVDAVPSLIDALEDPEMAVRESAVSSLRGITGRDFGYGYDADETDRAKKIKAWRSWWVKNEEALRKGAQPKD